MPHTKPATRAGGRRSSLSDRARASGIGVALASRGLSFVTAACTMFGMNSFSVYLPWVFGQGGTLPTSIVLGDVVVVHV